MKKYRVSGFCLVPTEVTLEVMASSEEDAIARAMLMDWKASVNSCDGDEQSAFDWEPAEARPVEEEHADSVHDNSGHDLAQVGKIE